MVRLVSHLHIQKGYKQPDKFIQKSEEKKSLVVQQLQTPLVTNLLQGILRQVTNNIVKSNDILYISLSHYTLYRKYLDYKYLLFFISMHKYSSLKLYNFAIILAQQKSIKRVLTFPMHRKFSTIIISGSNGYNSQALQL